MICGKICCGKSTYAKALAQKNRAVVLSVDEIMLNMFGQHCGDMHDEYAERTKKYLFSKSLELLNCGVDVIVDWGPWTKEGRNAVKAFYAARNIAVETHYISVSDAEWQARLKKRNAAVSAGETLDYYVDEGLAEKFSSLFEEPTPDEIDVWVEETKL